MLFSWLMPYRYTWKNAAKTSSIIPMKNSETFCMPVRAALYAAMFRNTWKASSATSIQFIHFSEKLIVATFCGLDCFASFDLRSASFASLIIM